jgi:tRNA-splicing ligase RtcB
MIKEYKIFGEEIIEPSAIDQFFQALEQPHAIQAALMPDAHFGYTLPIGGVISVDSHIYPSYVGYDIGCGVLSIKTNINVSDLNDTNKINIFNQIYRDIPTGVGESYKEQKFQLPDRILNMNITEFCKNKYDTKGIFDLGTLGSGNHMMELGVDEDGSVWITIHSGSRGFGHSVAEYYMILAGGGKREGHFCFNINSEEGKNYLNDLNFCLEYALENRLNMVKEIVKIINNEKFKNNKFKFEELVQIESLINRNHNHAEIKDNSLIIHRKGATHAENGMFGVIPANMRDGVYIVKGKGNPESLSSSSHGAGRQHSRKSAKENLKLDDFKLEMSGIVARVKPDTIDESPNAYKDICAVMENQKDLIEIVKVIKPIINIKSGNKKSW